ncbi:MAG TPA: sigma-70 family RNA polymerase sigma factor [Actinomycetota bacterium]
MGDPNVRAASGVIGVVEAVETAAPVSSAEDASFEEFFRAEYRSVVRALALVTGDAGPAEDLAQEAFARALERWGRVGAMASPAGYVYRAALNLYRSRVRRIAVGLRLRAQVSTPPDVGEQAALRAEVREMLRSLPPAQREALMLVEWLGYSAEEAAGILGVRPASVRGRLFRARTSLRERFGGDDG